MISEFDRARLLREFGELLNHPKADVMRTWTIRPVKLKPTTGEWAEYEAGPTIYWIIAIGDEQRDREAEVTKILGMNL